MSGTIPLSLTQQLDSLGKPLSGGKLYVVQAGTVSTPQNAYQDTALTLPWPNPIELDDAGRLPQFFLADGLIKVRLTDQFGSTIFTADNIQVIGPSSGGGGGGGPSVDPTTVLQTGMLVPFYGIGPISGFVRANGRTVGNVSSGATERANADTASLFSFLWNGDPNLVVSGGRGSSGGADYSAGKTIALPDFRGGTFYGLDDMGNSAANRLTTAGFGTSATVLGARGGAEVQTLAQTHLPSVSYPLIGTTGSVSVLSNDALISGTPGAYSTNGGATGFQAILNGSISSAQRYSVGLFQPQGSIGPIGSGAAHPSASPGVTGTWHMKL